MSDELEQLLRHADATSASPVEHIGDMGQRVRSLARRRRSARLAGSAAAMFIAALAALYAVRPHPAAPIVRDDAPAPSLDAIEDALAALDTEADARMAIVEHLVMAERRRDSARRIPAPDPMISVRREQDRAAYLLIYEAERLAQLSGEQARAAEEYRRVVALFPDTRWASVARERLAKTNSSSERSSAEMIRFPSSTKELS